MGSVKPCIKCGSMDRYPRGECKPCTRATQRKRRQADPERFNRMKREVRRRNLERARRRDAEWIDRNLERHMLIRAKASSKKRGLPFDISLNDIQIPETCPLLGCRLERRTDGSRKKAPNTPSLDRIDSLYVKDNVWVISWRANQLKSDGTLQEFEAIVAGMRAAVGRAAVEEKFVYKDGWLVPWES